MASAAVARRAWTRVVAVALVVTSAAGCQWPRDADGTLDRVREGTIRVGVAHNPPWTVTGGDAADGQPPEGVEAVLAQRLADSLGARVQWVRGSEAELMASLAERGLDLVVGGLDARSPWSQDVALTTDYLTTDTVVAVPAGSATEVAGQRVLVREGSTDAALLPDHDATAVPVADLPERPDAAAVVPDWLVDAIGLTDTGTHLSSLDHVMAVPPGENAWQSTVERFLLALDDDEVRRLLLDDHRAGA
ncbi:transporter substrate-binding domain-containing protein [Saccharothrix sp. 6-C]|uniref:transporter substrate-binding domain-containing protein n=1 Tax=Saccharothrix sp. 6-C TaxID=2781735 RepID=UPI0019178D52|nr:transporter substrate-binding domain-containing protein [Saccharothrix sp. 6-C]QQQ74017.1 transporter substrate-binding domain-containing protein [Saccharothrix sp. 6-C]